MDPSRDFHPACPVPIARHDTVQLAHGGGGRLMHQLIEKTFVSAFRNPLLEAQHDSAVIELGGEKLAFTTDSYVVHPLEFPGGDIGTLAIHGTVNDLAMSGARPLYLSAGFILEEGLPMATLHRIVESMRRAAEAARVQLVTGDTKVVDKGKGDGLFINTAGIGVIRHRLAITPASVRPGDALLVNGDLGRHGIAIMAVREGLAFETTIESDTAPLADLVADLLEAGIDIHCLRDITRSGLAGVLNEIAQASQTLIQVEEATVPVREDVHGACEILGFDPLYVACEGRLAAFVAPGDAERARDLMRKHPAGAQAAIIGAVAPSRPPGGTGLVTLKSRIGATRILDMLSGEQLPRIC